MMQYSCEKVVVFDLDDTLYKEVDFLFSGFHAIAVRIVEKQNSLDEEQVFAQMKRWRTEGRNVFDELCRLYPDCLTKEECLDIYRYHIPFILLSDGAKDLLKELKSRGVKLGIVTDGRTRTQMNKITALQLQEFIDKDDIVISESFGSEKPSEANYRYFMTRYPNAQYVYIADNTKKDFIMPNRLGWDTICLLDDGRNIHKQSFDVEEVYLPKFRVSTIKDCIKLLNFSI